MVLVSPPRHHCHNRHEVLPPPAPALRCGLEISLLKTILVIMFDWDWNAVCLCEICPLCRNPVSNSTNSTSDPSLEAAIEAPIGEGNVNAVAIEIPNFPTNVLIWGNESQVSTFGPCGEEDHHQGNETPYSSSSSMASLSGRREGVEKDKQKSAVPTRLRTEEVAEWE
ncbi:RING-H2 finger protein ATL3-like [Salvia miltiorrhiza]|uniref:RING-H2 finger protein ATL3-like n=1 Tax=Salvia miltiorrhiza TaxID=226208 RepID=UPI0025ACA941|nr:RING-H2 finger protein ATL3-like [Salvia miltiorrhiza]